MATWSVRGLFVGVLLQSMASPSTQLDFWSAFDAAKDITVGGFKAAGSVAKKAWCHNFECCTDRWTGHNLTGLEHALQKQVFGQHLVVNSLVRLLRAHKNNPSPSKALVLSLHGGAGTGKNFVSRILAQHLFRLGERSKYFRTFISTHHFPHEGDVTRYKQQLRDWIRGNVSACGKSLFVFDEMDKLPKGLVDVLTPFVDHHLEVDGVDYRHSIFLFLSNVGGKQINEIAFRHWRNGGKRTEMTVRQFDPVLLVGAYNEDGGFWHSAMIEKNVIDFHLPFLPLERTHIKQCAAVELRWRNVTHFTDDQLVIVANQMQYFPETHQLYSKSGCKKVASKVDLLFERRGWSSF